VFLFGSHAARVEFGLLGRQRFALGLQPGGVLPFGRGEARFRFGAQRGDFALLGFEPFGQLNRLLLFRGGAGFGGDGQRAFRLDACLLARQRLLLRLHARLF
ncbi:hypothetical protein ACEN88_35125, partial [Massilia sp. CT11-108]|uniref:hypothetical protein n=1 Tax=Massilia sp. CT11-108 TaxID=3393900 RepID=UPI0039A75D7C